MPYPTPAGSVVFAVWNAMNRPSVDDGVRRLAAFVVVEVREPHEVLPRAVELQFPDVDVAGPAHAAERLDLAIRLDARVLTVGKDALDFVVGARRFREVGDRL